MDDGYPFISIIIFIGFIILYAVFYGFGSAIQNININNLEKEMENGNKKAAKLLRIVNRPTRFVNAIQITTNLVGMLTGGFVLFHLKNQLVYQFNDVWDIPAPWFSLVSQVLLIFLLMLLLISFGIIVPKRCAARNPERWAYQTMPIVSMVMIPLVPFIWLVTGVSYVLLRIVGIDMMARDDNVTEEDIMSMVNEGHEQGILKASEAEMITNIFELDDKEAGDIMTHRKNLVALDCQMTLRDAVNFILKEGNNSRYPVYQKDVDDIIGILHMKDALIYSEHGGNGVRPLKEISGLIREAHFIPETRKISSLFKDMQSKKVHMAVVVDEYGQTAGIVTMEDILEEIVGNILDEYDVDEEFIVQSEDGSFIMSGMTPLEDAAEVLELDFEEEDYDMYDTVNGFLVSKLDRIPQENEESEVEYQGYCFKIMRVQNKIIHSVRVTHTGGLPVKASDEIEIS